MPEARRILPDGTEEEYRREKLLEQLPFDPVPQPLPGTTITVPTRYAAVRFLNATHGYPAFRIFVDGTRVVNLLNSGTASGYVRIPAGNRTITVAGQDGYIYIEDVLPFASGSTSTVAIINRAGGLSLTKIADACRVI